MPDRPKIVELKSRDELETALAKFGRASSIVAKTCRMYADSLAAEDFSDKQICRILGTYLSQI